MRGMPSSPTSPVKLFGGVLTRTAWGRPSHPMAKFLPPTSLSGKCHRSSRSSPHERVPESEGRDLSASTAFSFLSLLFKSPRTWGRYSAEGTPPHTCARSDGAGPLGNFYRTLPREPVCS